MPLSTDWIFSAYFVGRLRDFRLRTLYTFGGLSRCECRNYVVVIALVASCAKPSARKPEVINAPEQSGRLSGNVNTLELRQGDQPLPMPHVALAMQFAPEMQSFVNEAEPDGVRKLYPPDEKGYPGGVIFSIQNNNLPDNGQWQLAILQIQPSGEQKIVFSQVGNLPIPRKLSWNGLTNQANHGSSQAIVPAGHVYLAQLNFFSADKEAQSEWQIFAVVPKNQATDITWPGAWFAGNKLNTELKKKLTTLAKSINPQDHLVIESHGDGKGDRLESLAQTQKEAEAIAMFLEQQGVARANIEPRGRGATELIAPAISAAGKKQNRRVHISISPAVSLEEVPIVQAIPSALVNGRVISSNDRGEFSLPTSIAQIPGAANAMVVDMQQQSGKRTAIRFGEPAPSLPECPNNAPNSCVKQVTIEGDIKAGTFALGGGKILNFRWADLSVNPVSGKRENGVNIRIDVPKTSRILDWTLSVRSAGKTVASWSGALAPPYEIFWDLQSAGKMVPANAKLTFQLTAKTEDGWTYISPPTTFSLIVDAKTFRGILFRGEVPSPKFAAALRELAQKSPNGQRVVAITLIKPAGADASLFAASQKVSLEKWLTQFPGRWQVSAALGSTESAKLEIEEKSEPQMAVWVNGGVVPTMQGRFRTSIKQSLGAALILEVENERAGRSRVVLSVP